MLRIQSRQSQLTPCLPPAATKNSAAFARNDSSAAKQRVRVGFIGLDEVIRSAARRVDVVSTGDFTSFLVGEPGLQLRASGG